MTSLKLLVLAVCLLALAESGWADPLLDVWLRMDDKYNWEKFRANVTVKLNYGDAIETVKTCEPIPVSPPNWWSFRGRPTRHVDEVKSIEFEYKSVDSPKDKFALDQIQLVQHDSRGRYVKTYVYTRNFVLNVTGWLEQNKVYTGLTLSGNN